MYDRGYERGYIPMSIPTEVPMKASIADVRNKLSVGWLTDNGIIEVTAHNVVVATIVPVGMAIPNTDPRVPPRTGTAATAPPSGTPLHRGTALSKADQASGQSRKKG
jgi:hypothetical protein